MNNDKFALCHWNEEEGEWYAMDHRMIAMRLEALRQQPEFAELESRTPAAPVPESIANNHDAMIILTQGYPREAVIKVVDAHTARQIRAVTPAAPVVVEGLTDTVLDNAASDAIDRTAKQRNIATIDVNTDITANWTLRRELVAAGYRLATHPAAPAVVAEGWAFPTFEDWLASPIESPSSPNGLSIQYAELAFNAGRAAHPVAGSPTWTQEVIDAVNAEAEQLASKFKPVAGSPAEVGSTFDHYRTGFEDGKKFAAEPMSTDPMGWPLPCDVKVGHGTIGKGCKLSTLVARMNVLYDMAHEKAEPMPASEAPTDAEIIAACHSVGVDTYPSVYGFDALQVKTSIPVLRNIFNKLHTAAPVPASEAVNWRDKLRRSKANIDYHGCIAFTPGQLEHFVSMLLAAPAAPTESEDDKKRQALSNLGLGAFADFMLPPAAPTDKKG